MLFEYKCDELLNDKQPISLKEFDANHVSYTLTVGIIGTIQEPLSTKCWLPYAC